MSTNKIFSHVFKFTGYMRKIEQWFSTKPAGMKILDMPAGAGIMREALSKYGHNVICGDINKEKPDYIFVDMNKPLPFSDSEFDAVICLEGIEHAINPIQLIQELIRITRKGGNIILSTPNITNMYSRLQFLFTGIFYQFNPASNPKVTLNEMKDRGHISPLAYYQLRYLFEHYGADIIYVDGDRFKRKILFPIYFIIMLFGWFWSVRLLLSPNNKDYYSRNKEIYKHMFTPHVLLSRSIILYLRRNPG